MGSAQFQDIIRKSVKEGVVDGNKASQLLLDAEKALTKTKKYKVWAESLGQADRALLQGGLLGYLFGQEQEER